MIYTNRLEDVVKDFVMYVNSKTKAFALNGKAALFMCYGLDRTPGVIDFESYNDNIEIYVESFCAERGYSYEFISDTTYKEVLSVDCGNGIKVLIRSFKKFHNQLWDADVFDKEGIKVHDLDTAVGRALLERHWARVGERALEDIYTYVYVVRNFYTVLNEWTCYMLVEHFFYSITWRRINKLLKTVKDHGIDEKQFKCDYKEACKIMGLDE